MAIRPLSQAYNSRTGSTRPARPAQLSDAALGQLGDGGSDPEKIVEMRHVTAEGLLHKVRVSQDPIIVQRVVTLVENEGVEIIAELWEDAEPTSLPGVLWRLYLLRSWMRKNPGLLSRLWRLGEPQGGAASAVTGIDEAPTPEDITRTADSILSGAFMGDFAVALDRSVVFIQVIVRGAHEFIDQRKNEEQYKDEYACSIVEKQILATLHMCKKLDQVEEVFRIGAKKWRAGELN